MTKERTCKADMTPMLYTYLAWVGGTYMYVCTLCGWDGFYFIYLFNFITIIIGHT